MSLFRVKFFAFYLISTFLLVSSAPPEPYLAHAVASEPHAGNATIKPTLTAVEHDPTQKIPALHGQKESKNTTDSVTSKTQSHVGANNSSSNASDVNKIKNNPPNEKSATSNSSNATVAAKDATIPVTSSSTTTAPPHHKKSHTSATTRPTPHPHPAIPVNPMPDNVIEDVNHPAPRPLRASEKFNPTFGAIVAAICITTAVGGYVILMVWRKIEMDRYGNRQMLINEDDFGDIQDEDMRHFEASCIQIDP